MPCLRITLSNCATGQFAQKTPYSISSSGSTESSGQFAQKTPYSHSKRLPGAFWAELAAWPMPRKPVIGGGPGHRPDRKSTRLNSSHLVISYAVFCLNTKQITLQLPLTVANNGAHDVKY